MPARGTVVWRRAAVALIPDNGDMNKFDGTGFFSHRTGIAIQIYVFLGWPNLGSIRPGEDPLNERLNY